jgi:hypothetical protein
MKRLSIANDSNFVSLNQGMCAIRAHFFHLSYALKKRIYKKRSEFVRWMEKMGEHPAATITTVTDPKPNEDTVPTVEDFFA